MSRIELAIVNNHTILVIIYEINNNSICENFLDQTFKDNDAPEYLQDFLKNKLLLVH